MQGVATGAAVGTFVPIVINPLEKVNTQVMVGGSRRFFLKAICTEPFKGTKVSMTNSMMKTMILFGTIPLYQSLTDKYIPRSDLSKYMSYVFSSLTMNYALSPLQVIKARLYTQIKEKTTLEVWNSMPASNRYRLLFAGSSTSAVKVSLYWPTFLALSDNIHERLQKWEIHHSLAPLISGSLGVCGAYFVTYPFDVISKRQKVGNLPNNFFQAAKIMFQNEGWRVFFRGLLQANMTRIFVAGPMTEIIIVKINKLFDNNCKHA